jgi:hypothetical protein
MYLQCKYITVAMDRKDNRGSMSLIDDLILHSSPQALGLYRGETPIRWQASLDQ